MGRRVLLISLNRCTTPDPVFPLGLAHLNAALRRAGYETRWLDVQKQTEELEPLLANYRPHFAALSLRNIDDVVVGKRETFFGEAITACERIRAAAPVPIIIGGSGFSIFPRQLLELTGADFGICGEGEEPLIQLLQALETGVDPGSIPGLVFRQGNEVIVNGLPGSTATAELSASDWPPALTAHYLQTSGMLNVQTQRGCGFHCCYCTYPVIEGRQHRRRPPERVAEDFDRLAALGARYVFIVDSVFNSSTQHVVETCEAILRRGPKLRWTCFLRPAGLSSDLVKLMARAGLAHIEFGTDSFCDPVLHAYGKSFTFADVLRSSELAHREKIDYCHFLICGGPGETAATLQTGYENSRRLPGAVILAVIGMRIYPGTPLCQRALAEGRIQSQTSLLEPHYYLESGLTEETVAAQLREFASRSSQWVVGEPSPAYLKLAERLRGRGVIGPLWSYFSTLQRLWPREQAPRF